MNVTVLIAPRPHTCVQSAAQKVEPHGDVVIPVQGVDSDTFGDDWAVKIVSYYGVFICISNKNLKRKHASNCIE